MAVPGAGASLKIGDAANVLTEVATWLESISNSGDADELDGTVFVPGATVATKITLFGAVNRSMSISGRWDAAAETFFNSISGLQNRNYEYGPEGTAVGKTKISGTLNVGIWNGPGDQNVNGVIGFTLELRVNSRTVGTF
jgi:hypothetical protein